MYCLVAIVRNEAQNVARLLDSATAVASEYVIVDTGSDDDTIDKLREHPLPGHVVQHPFVDFSDARNKSLESARILSSPTSIFFLLMDADMELVVTDPAALDALLADADAAMLIQTHGTFAYQNIRFVRRSMAEAKYVGPTHEYLDTPPGARVVHVPESIARIVDIGDGGCKHDKFERDIRLLTTYLETHPKDERSLFYLGESYFYSGALERALQVYRERLAIENGWDQEILYSRYRVVLCLLGLGRLDEAFDTLPAVDARAEPLMAVARAMREAGKHHKAFYLTMRARAVPTPPADALFVERSVYTYAADAEAAILWYYIDPADKARGLELSWRVLCNPAVDEATWWCIHNNLRWYIEGPPPGTTTADAPAPPPLVEEPWSVSTPSTMGDRGVVYRIVNYHIEDDGTYTMPPDDVVRTRNYIATLGFLKDPTPPFPDANIRGFEDLRIAPNGKALAATRDHCPNGESIAQVLLDIDPATLQVKVNRVLSDGSRCEKNWVWVTYPWYVYEWFPEVVIRSVEDDDIEVRVRSQACMRGMRGSSNACTHRGLSWFVTHSVADEPSEIRRYHHYIVAMDFEGPEPRVAHVTPPFTFSEGADVEYCTFLRATSDGRAFLCGYSRRDGTRGVGWVHLTIPLV